MARGLMLVCLALLSGAAIASAQVTTGNMPGVTNLARVETTVACAGATDPSAFAEIRKQGFASIINLRMPHEPGVDIPAATAAAQAARINYVHIPFNSSSPDAAAVDRFLSTLADPANTPAFIHCATANRAAALWLIKRVLNDAWSVERAVEEAEALGLRNSALKAFALEYIAGRRK